MRLSIQYPRDQGGKPANGISAPDLPRALDLVNLIDRWLSRVCLFFAGPWDCWYEGRLEVHVNLFKSASRESPWTEILKFTYVRKVPAWDGSIIALLGSAAEARDLFQSWFDCCFQYFQLPQMEYLCCSASLLQNPHSFSVLTTTSSVIKLSGLSAGRNPPRIVPKCG